MSEKDVERFSSWYLQAEAEAMATYQRYYNVAVFNQATRNLKAEEKVKLIESALAICNHPRASLDAGYVLSLSGDAMDFLQLFLKGVSQ